MLHYNLVSESIIDNYKETDSGRYGKAFEENGKALIKGNRGNTKVSSKGKIDCYYKGWKLEFKVNCGSFLGDIAKNDFMVYSYDGNNDWKEPWKAHVIPMDDFLAGLEALGLYRLHKLTTNFQVTHGIQSFRNSRKKEALWLAFIDRYPTLDDWAETIEHK